MRAQFVIPVLATILILGTVLVSVSFDDAFAKKGDNSGNKGCEKANPRSKVCEKNPNTEPTGNLIIFVNGDDIGFSGIECEVFSGRNGCPFRSFGFVPFDQGTTDENGMLSFDIPEAELPFVTVVCDLSEVEGGRAGWWYQINVETYMSPFDFNTADGTNMCCPI